MGRKKSRIKNSPSIMDKMVKKYRNDAELKRTQIGW